MVAARAWESGNSLPTNPTACMVHACICSKHASPWNQVADASVGMGCLLHRRLGSRNGTKGNVGVGLAHEKDKFENVVKHWF